MLSAALLYSQAEEEAKPKEGEIKIYKRLIPADVLRGMSIRFIGSRLGSRVMSAIRNSKTNRVLLQCINKMYVARSLVPLAKVANKNSSKQISYNLIQLGLIQLMRTVPALWDVIRQIMESTPRHSITECRSLSWTLNRLHSAITLERDFNIQFHFQCSLLVSPTPSRVKERETQSKR